MNQIVLLSKNILKLLFRKKGSFIIYILLPIIGIMVPMMLFSNQGEVKTRVGIVNKDAGFVSTSIIHDLKSQKRYQVTDLNESDINKKITEGSLDCAVVIPEGYSEAMLKGEPKMLELVSIQGISATGWLDGYLTLNLSNVSMIAQASKGDEAVFKSMYEAYTASPTPVKSESVKNTVRNSEITYLGLGFLIQFLLVGAGKTAALIIRERQEKTLARIRVAPVKGYNYITSNVVINVVLVTLQTMITLMALRYIFNIDFGTSILNMMIVMFPLLVAAVGLTLMLVSFAKNEGHLGTLLTIFVYPTCLISGCFWDVEMMPEFMQKIANFLPQRWALDGVESLLLGNSLEKVLPNIAVLCAFALAFFAIAVYGFNKQQLAKA